MFLSLRVSDAVSVSAYRLGLVFEPSCEVASRRKTSRRRRRRRSRGRRPTSRNRRPPKLSRGRGTWTPSADELRRRLARCSADGTRERCRQHRLRRFDDGPPTGRRSHQPARHVLLPGVSERNVNSSNV